jgi:hypothetical protein
MPNVTLEFPKVIVIENLKEQGAKNLATNQELVNKITSEAFNGVVTLDGKWGMTTNGQLMCPGGGWDIVKLGVGQYKVVHMQGYMNISLSVTPLQSPCTIEIKENHPSYFVVHTSVNGIPYDMPFAFTLVKVISPSVPQSIPQKPLSLLPPQRSSSPDKSLELDVPVLVVPVQAEPLEISAPSQLSEEI